MKYLILFLFSFNLLAASVSFRNRLGYLESRNDYRAVNRFGYLGIYQFGHSALQDLGYKNRNTWTCKMNICSAQDFLNNPREQERAFDMWTILLESEARRLKLFNRGYTKSQIIAGCHLVGCFGVFKSIIKGKKITDGNNVNVKRWMHYFRNIPY